MHNSRKPTKRLTSVNEPLSVITAAIFTLASHHPEMTTAARPSTQAYHKVAVAAQKYTLGGDIHLTLNIMASRFATASNQNTNITQLGHRCIEEYCKSKIY